jgi:hypothetical protein
MLDFVTLGTNDTLNNNQLADGVCGPLVQYYHAWKVIIGNVKKFH